MCKGVIRGFCTAKKARKKTSMHLCYLVGLQKPKFRQHLNGNAHQMAIFQPNFCAIKELLITLIVEKETKKW